MTRQLETPGGASAAISAGARAMAPGLVARLAASLPAMIGDLGRLVACESPSADLAALARSAEAVARLGAGLTGHEPEVISNGGPAHLRWEIGSRSRRVLLVGHHDTVWPAGSLDTHPWSVDGDVARGPGCLDMKAGLVQMFHALSVTGDLDGVTVLVTGDEEVGSPTSAALIENAARRSAAALVLEMAASDAALKTARKGMSCYQVTVTGRAAHAGLDPASGVNATLEAARQALALAALADPSRGTTVTPTVLHSGTAANVVPGHAMLTVDVRVKATAEQRRVDAAMRQLAPLLPGARVQVSGGPNCPPMEPSASQALFARTQRIARLLGLEPPRAAAVGGSSDGNRTAGAGTPTLDGLGAVGAGAHADDEHVRLAMMPPRAALLAALVRDLLDDDASSAMTNQAAPDRRGPR